MKLHIISQYRENYGAHDWDGKGSCPQYWKNKGGMDYYVPLDMPFGEMTTTALQAVVNAVAGSIENASEYSTNHIIHWELVEDSFMCETEKLQLEFEGKIVYPAEILAYPA